MPAKKRYWLMKSEPHKFSFEDLWKAKRRTTPWDGVRNYKARNLIERMFCRLKDFRRIATRYDKRADTFMSAVFIAATLIWWLN